MIEGLVCVESSPRKFQKKAFKQAVPTAFSGNYQRLLWPNSGLS